MRTLVSDDLWRQFEPPIPKHARSPKGGRPRADDRTCLEGLVYMARGGLPWGLFPDRQFGVGKGTVYDRFAEWADAGVFADAHHAVLDELGPAGRLDRSAMVVDSASVRAVFGGRTPGPARSTAARPGASGM